MAKGTGRGLFITLEGGEGTGKSTQAKLLADRLRAEGHALLLTREPAGMELGQRVKRLLEEDISLAPLAELLLFEAARAQHVAEVIRPALERGDIVVCDRFTDSTLAYQGSGRGLDRGLIRTLNQAASAGLTPDLTVLLDLPPAVGLARADARPPQTGRMAGRKGQQEARDRIGTESLEFHQRVRDGYRALAEQEPSRFLVLDAALPAQQVVERIAHRLRPLLAHR